MESEGAIGEADEVEGFIFLPGGGGLSLSDPELEPVASEEEAETVISVSPAAFLFLC